MVEKQVIIFVSEAISTEEVAALPLRYSIYIERGILASLFEESPMLTTAQHFELTSGAGALAGSCNDVTRI